MNRKWPLKFQDREKQGKKPEIPSLLRRLFELVGASSFELRVFLSPARWKHPGVR